MALAGRKSVVKNAENAKNFSTINESGIMPGISEND